MKKFLSAALAGLMSISLVACGGSNTDSETTGGETAGTDSGMKVAMVTDYGDITDQSFNQTTYEASKAYCEEKGYEFTYKKPASDADADRVASIEEAIEEGYNVIVMPGFAFAKAIVDTVELYPDVKFFALDVAQADFNSAAGVKDGDPDWEIPSNLFSAVYHEEIAGYMAGYAAVKLGYTKLGFLGGMAVPAVIRYGFGYVQGADDAAVELGLTDVELKYIYGGAFAGNADVTARMDTWYGDGTEVVFASGGGIYTSAAEAAAKVDGKVIGVDVDQAPIFDAAYREAMTVTSAMKGLAATVDTVLSDIDAGNWADYQGTIQNLGLVSENSEENYVQLPSSTQWDDNFTEDDYNELVAKLYNGEITVDDGTEAMPETEVVAVDDQGSLK